MRPKQNRTVLSLAPGTGQHAAGLDGAPCMAAMGTEGQSWGSSAPLGLPSVPMCCLHCGPRDQMPGELPSRPDPS